MIVVRRYGDFWTWRCRNEYAHGFATADRALNDAWRWLPQLPALIYTVRA